jgi:hypothetical protein
VFARSGSSCKTNTSTTDYLALIEYECILLFSHQPANSRPFCLERFERELSAPMKYYSTSPALAKKSASWTSYEISCHVPSTQCKQYHRSLIYLIPQRKCSSSNVQEHRKSKSTYIIHITKLLQPKANRNTPNSTLQHMNLIICVRAYNRSHS